MERTVYCPCGRRCPATDDFGRVPLCVESFSGDSIPRQFRYNALAILAMTTGRSYTSGPVYTVFECSACGCEVLIGEWSTNHGDYSRRVAQNATC
jgi:hypothetical protein